MNSWVPSLIIAAAIVVGVFTGHLLRILGDRLHAARATKVITCALAALLAFMAWWDMRSIYAVLPFVGLIAALFYRRDEAVSVFRDRD